MGDLSEVGMLGFFGRFEQEIRGNDWHLYLVALGVTVALLLLVLGLSGILRKRLTNWISTRGQRTNVALVDSVIRAMFGFLLLVPFYTGITLLKFSPEVTRGIGLVFLFLFTWRAMVFFSRFFIALLDALLSRSSSYIGVRAVSPIVTFIVWALGISFLLDNMGMKISSIMAGLGIMGIAVGLASQAILGDFFGYLSILLDRPFKIGDVVTFGTNSGTIERVGFRTTKLRTATGELVSMPNGDVSKQTMTNASLAESRGRVFRFGVAYETPVEKVKGIPAMIREIVASAADNASLGRVHFIDFGEYSLVFEVLFTVPGNSRLDLLNAQNAINLAIVERFSAEGIKFAYPTRTVHLANQFSTDAFLQGVK